MQDYSISFSYKYSKSLINKQLFFALENTDFKPQSMLIGYGDDETESIETDFNFTRLFELMNTQPVLITIYNMSYEERNNSNDYKILKLQTYESFNTFNIYMSKISLDILQKKPLLDEFIFKEEFICGYCYNHSDAFDQLLKYREYENSKKSKLDINLYGRLLSIVGLDFVAAPIIWLGTPIYDIVDKNLILKYPGLNKSKIDNIEIYTIHLFDINTLPTQPENRSKQRHIWDYLNIENSFKNYSEKKERERNEKLGITPDMDLLEYLKIMSGKKKKK
jgi:hypothetical protein